MYKIYRLFFFLLISSSSFAQWQMVSNGLWPDNSNQFLRQIKAICNFNGTLFVANTYGHLAKSSDDGANWITFSPPGFPTDTYINSLATLNNRVFFGALSTGSFYGIYYTEDNGVTVVEANNGIPVSSTIVCLAAKESKIYAGGLSFYVSSDQGNSWVTKANGLPNFLFGVNVIAFDDAGTIYIGSNNRKIYKSTNEGDDWTQLGTNGLPTSGSGVGALIYANGVLIVSVGADGIFTSSDDGANWTASTGITATNHKPANDFISVGLNVIAASAGGGAFISSDNGSSWSVYNEGATSGLLCFTLKDNFIFAGGNGKGVFKRENTAVSIYDENLNEMKFELSQNYPNPFNPNTKIKYTVSSRQYGTLKVYDVLGNEISILVNEVKEPGEYEVEFNADNLSSGVYLYHLSINGLTQTRKMLLMK